MEEFSKYRQIWQRDDADLRALAASHIASRGGQRRYNRNAAGGRPMTGKRAALVRLGLAQAYRRANTASQPDTRSDTWLQIVTIHKPRGWVPVWLRLSPGFNGPGVYCTIAGRSRQCWIWARLIEAEAERLAEICACWPYCA